MRYVLAIVACSLVICVSSCSFGNQNNPDKVQTEKEIELLKKENELLKREQQLISKNIQLKNSSTAKSTTNKLDNWVTFNHKFGYTIQLPNYFSVGSLTASGIQYYTTDIDDDIIVAVESSEEGSQTVLIKDYQMRLNTEEGIKYNILHDNWFVVSGQNSQGIYYFKEIIRNGQIYFLMISYPPVHKDLMDNILPRVVKSFF